MNQAVLCIDYEKFDAMMSRITEYTQRYRESEDPAVQRGMWLDALRELICFMDDLQPDWMPSSILVELSDDLIDLDAGITSPRLKRVKTRRRPHYNSYEIVQVATQSVLVDFLLLAGLSEAKAAKRVTERARKFGVPLPKATKKSNRSDHVRLLDRRARLRSPPADDGGFNFSEFICGWWRHHFNAAKKNGLSDKEAADYMLDTVWPFKLGILKSDVHRFFSASGQEKGNQAGRVPLNNDPVPPN